jgi:hypothetical protein
MTRYKGRVSARAIERDFPHVVETVVPEGSGPKWCASAKCRAYSIYLLLLRSLQMAFHPTFALANQLPF